MEHNTTFEELEAAILARLDIQAAYEAFPEWRWAGDGNGHTRPCYAYGRQDNSASAYVNLRTGRYKDVSRMDREITLWEFAATIGAPNHWQGNWKDARRHYAELTGAKPGGLRNFDLAKAYALPAPPPPAKPVPPRDEKHGLWFKPLPPDDEMPGRFTAFMRQWIVAKGVINNAITQEGVRKAGCQVGTKIKDGKPLAGSDVFLAWPAYDASLLNADLTISEPPPTGWLVVDPSSHKIKIKQGNDDSCYAKVQCIGGPGLVGATALHTLIARPGEAIIIKCEGLSDCITAESQLPKITSDIPICAVTNMNGSSENPAPLIPLLKQAKEVWVIGDNDEAGKKGQAKWLAALQDAGIPCKGYKWNSTIKDVREHVETYGNMEHIVATFHRIPNYGAPAPADAPPPPPPLPPQPDPRGDGEEPVPAICATAHIQPIGQTDDLVSYFYSYALNRMVAVPLRLSNLKYHDLVQYFGPTMDTIKDTANPEDPRPYWKDLITAMAGAVSQCLISEENSHGAGVWMVGENLVLVNHEGITLLAPNNQLSIHHYPKVGNNIFSWGGEDRWFSRAQLAEDFAEFTANPGLIPEIAERVAKLAGLWTFRSVDDAHFQQQVQLLTGLLGASLIQSTWQWRPTVTVNAASGSGKTELLNTIIALLGPDITRKVDKPSAAGIRQLVRQGGYVLLIDEFEKAKGRQDILEMLRTSGSGSQTVRGTPGQKVRVFTLRAIPWLASIESGIDESADDNRRIPFEIQPSTRTYAAFLAARDEIFSEQLSRKFRSAMLFVAHRALKLEREIRSLEVDGVVQRRRDTYAAPMAAYGALTGQSAVCLGKIIVNLLTSRDTESAPELPDEARLIQDIFDAKLYDPALGSFSLRQWYERGNLTDWATDEERKRARLFGFRVATDGGVFLHPKIIQREVLNNCTQWEGMKIVEILRRIPGAKSDKQLFASQRDGLYGIKLPAKSIEELLDYET